MSIQSHNFQYSTEDIFLEDNVDTILIEFLYLMLEYKFYSLVNMVQIFVDRINYKFLIRYYLNKNNNFSQGLMINDWWIKLILLCVLLWILRKKDL